MDLQQLTHKAIRSLHRAMKNIMEIAFAVSPLLALSTHGWASKSFNSTYLLRVSLVFIYFRYLLTTIKISLLAIRLKDQVLQAITCISEGKSLDNAMSTLYCQIRSMEEELADDEAALNWFKFTTTEPSETTTPNIPSTPLASMSHHLQNRFQG
jgi:hypothetical protein